MCIRDRVMENDFFGETVLENKLALIQQLGQQFGIMQHRLVQIGIAGLESGKTMRRKGYDPPGLIFVKKFGVIFNNHFEETLFPKGENLAAAAGFVVAKKSIVHPCFIQKADHVLGNDLNSRIISNGAANVEEVLHGLIGLGDPYIQSFHPIAAGCSRFFPGIAFPEDRLEGIPHRGLGFTALDDE